MYLLLKKIIFTGFVCLQVIVACGQTRFTATLIPAQINKDEYCTLRLVVENSNDIQKISPPSLQNFIIVSGPNQESGMSSVNGNVTQYVALSYVLQPRKPGQFSVGTATAVIGGKAVKSNAVSLTVKNVTGGVTQQSNAAATPLSLMDAFNDRPSVPDFKDYILHKGDNVADKVSKNMQLRLQTDKTSCYVGEPIVATYKLYTRLKSESKLSKNPSFNGFSVIDLSQPDIGNYKRETLDGRDYNVYTIRKAQLYPLQAGDIGLETATLDNDVQFLKDDGSNGPNNVSDLMNGLSINPDAVVTESVSLSSKPVNIVVKPLPETGKPVSFKGAVGEFKVETALAKTSFSTDETGTLAVRISGNGNLQLLTAPDISWPDGIDGFDPKVNDNTQTTTVPVSGSKTFIYSFAVQKEGSYTLPAINFSYFDPATATYKTIETKPIPFLVTKGTGLPVYKTPAAQGEENISFVNKIFHHRWWIIVFVGIMIFVLLYFWLKKEKTAEHKKQQVLAKMELDEKLNSVVEESAINQQNPLAEAETCLYTEDCVEFYALLNKEMKAFLEKKCSLNPQQINYKTIAVALDRAGIENDTVLKLQQLMQEIEWQVYTPFVQTEKRNEMYSRSHDIIQEINGQVS